MTRSLRLGVRTRLLLAVVGVVAVALTIGVAAFNFLLGQRLSANATSLARARAVAELPSLKVVDRKLLRPKGSATAALGSPVWVFAGTSALEAPSADVELDRLAVSLAVGPERSANHGDETRLYAVPVVYEGTRVGTVVAAVNLDPYAETARTALVGSLILAVLLLVAVTLVTRWILGKAFLPVSRMTEDAAAWSDHDLDRRFDLGEPYDEVTSLASTLDAMLARLAASLRHEQRFTAELSHELRTPLAKIAAETELALRRTRTTDEYRASLGAVHRNADQMTRTVEALVSAARQEAGLTQTTSDALDAVRHAVDSVRSEADDASVALRVSLPPQPVRVAVEGELLESILQPLLDNAIRYGHKLVAIDVTRNGSTAFVEVLDDGVGVTVDESDRIFEPGSRGAAAVSRSGGAGLGLALARRLARSAGGEIVVQPSSAGGRFTLRIPTA